MRWNYWALANNFMRRFRFVPLQCSNYSYHHAILHKNKYGIQVLTTSTHQNFLVGPKCLNFPNVRSYAKGKDKKKENKGKKKVEINEDVLSEVIKLETLKNQMQKAVDTLKDDYVKNLSLRSTTGAIESLKVDFEGSEYALQELAQVVRKNPKTVIIDMSAFPQSIPAVLQSIKISGMNLNPQQDGTTLFVPVPVVTKEYREGLAKNAKTLFIKCRDSIKDVQNKYIKSVKRSDNISEDTAHEVQEQIIAIADQYIANATKMYESKVAELLH